jgi:hypothetical protein
VNHRSFLAAELAIVLIKIVTAIPGTIHIAAITAPTSSPANVANQLRSRTSQGNSGMACGAPISVTPEDYPPQLFQTRIVVFQAFERFFPPALKELPTDILSNPNDSYSWERQQETRRILSQNLNPNDVPMTPVASHNST